MDLSLSSLAKEKDHGAVRASLPNLEIVLALLGKTMLLQDLPRVGLAGGDAPESGCIQLSEAN